MSLKKKIVKGYFSMISKTFHLTKEKVKLSYIFKKNKKSSILIVVFSAFPRPHMEATYNYMNTLKSFKVNKLFLLDNFGSKKRGAFYLVEEGKINLKSGFITLIEQIKKENGINRTIFIGSSKGGYSALNFGFSMEADYIICGAPMFYLGNYLTDAPAKELIFKGMIGTRNKKEAKIEFNTLLKNNIQKAKKVPTLYVHYSDQEHLYEDHIVHLLNCLDKKGVVYESNIAHYKVHQEVRNYFPNYLRKTLETIFEKNKE